ncbi:hypothetical protein E1301_Tti019194 [Triplophysa tibetana]|uniref:Uncharacterized protein n=1 Tax=Triplophysa tibetana TaxID=1572043 RepID=A0A5A9P496_9TELE|nr:hypothetical protein E1301_Tti019194 [Triplophysa tibetana]
MHVELTRCLREGELLVSWTVKGAKGYVDHPGRLAAMIHIVVERETTQVGADNNPPRKKVLQHHKSTRMPVINSSPMRKCCKCLVSIDLERLYMTTVRRILKPSVLRNHKQLRELDLTQSGIFLSPPDADLGTTFMDKLEESRLAPDMKERISSRCMDFLKELVKQYQLRLPASMEILSKLELFCPKSVMSTVNRPGVKDLPADLFSCPSGTLETQWRNVATANFSDDQDIDKFWLEVEAFKDAGGTSVSRNWHKVP